MGLFACLRAAEPVKSGDEDGAANGVAERGTLLFWDLASNTKPRSLQLEGERIYSIALSPDGKWAASYGLCKIEVKEIEPRERSDYYFALRLWDTSNGKLIRTLYEDGRYWHSPMCFSPDGAFLIEARHGTERPSGEWAIEKWDSKTGKSLGVKDMSKKWPPLAVGCVGISPDGKHAGIGSHHGVSLWDLEAGRFIWHHSTTNSRNGVRYDDWQVRWLEFSRDGKQLVASGFGGFLDGRPADQRGGMVVIDASTGKAVAGFVGTKDWVCSVRFTPDVTMLLGGSREGIRFWDLRTGEKTFTFSE